MIELGYCGLYCPDCAGYSGDIAKAATKLKKQLNEYKFERTAKSLFPEKLKDYDKFLEVIGFLTNTKCPTICRERKEDEVNCEIWTCCREKGFLACYECGEFEECEKLKTMEDLHGDACIKNLRSIRDMGIEKWLKEGKRYWFGSEVYD